MMRQKSNFEEQKKENFEEKEEKEKGIKRIVLYAWIGLNPYTCDLTSSPMFFYSPGS